MISISYTTSPGKCKDIKGLQFLFCLRACHQPHYPLLALTRIAPPQSNFFATGSRARGGHFHRLIFFECTPRTTVTKHCFCLVNFCASFGLCPARMARSVGVISLGRFISGTVRYLCLTTAYPETGNSLLATYHNAFLVREDG